METNMVVASQSDCGRSWHPWFYKLLSVMPLTSLLDALLIVICLIGEDIKVVDDSLEGSSIISILFCTSFNCDTWGTTGVAI